MKNILRKLRLLFLCLVTVLVYQCQPNTYELPNRGVCAHRGARETHPENTIAAFNEAIRLGAQMIEFDVRMTKDQQLIIMHDESIDRTTNGTGLVDTLTWSVLKQLDAGAWKSAKFKGERIPSFKEALTNFPKNVWLNVHLKGSEKLGEAVAKIIIQENRAQQVVIACTEKSALGVRKVDSTLRICNMERTELRKDYITQTIKENFSTIQLLKKRNDSSFANDITKLKKQGVRINYHFSNTAEEGIELFEKGIDFILTDSLETMLKAAEIAGIQKLKQ